MHNEHCNLFSALNPSLRSSGQPQRSNQGPTPDSKSVPRSRALTGDRPNVCVFDGGGNWSTRRKPKQTREHHLERPCPSTESKPGPSCYEATVPTTTSPCHQCAITKNTCLTRKNMFSSRGILQHSKSSSNDIKNKFFMAKLNYKNELVQECAIMNTKQCVRTLTGQVFKQTTNTPAFFTFANDLNSFYAWYDTRDFSEECESLFDSLPFHELDYELCLIQKDVCHLQFIRCKRNKGFWVKGNPRAGLVKWYPGTNSHPPLSPRDHSHVNNPVIWKTLTITPVPPKNPQC